MGAESLSLKEIFFWDLERELSVTRKVLERLPGDKFSWKPHEKSMSLGRLGMHVATLPGWILNSIAEDELDMATMPRPREEAKDLPDLLGEFDKNAGKLREAVSKFDPGAIGKTWTMRNGGQVFTSQPRIQVYRTWSLNHLIHHRAQLCVYLRLLNVPVPAVYFNSADEPDWNFE